MDQPNSSVVASPSGIQPARRLDMRFTGSGSEYFRIWIVNLLLTLVTLGFYYPYAKVRRLSYFYSNTLVGGHALGFHANPRTMLRGYLLVGLMFLLYGVASKVSGLAGLIAFLIVAAVWPALLKSSLQFRLANTSWRGLRLRFKGSTGDAYRALLPLLLIPAVFLLVPLLAPSAAVDGQSRAALWYGVSSLLAMAASALVVPWSWWRLKKYQHDHYAFGSLQTRLQAGPGPFYAVFLKTGGVLLLTAAALGVLVALVAAGGLLDGLRVRDGGQLPGRSGAAFMAAFAIFLVGLLGMWIVPRVHFTSRMQNLLWSRTGAAALQFASALRFRPLFALTLKNWLLTLLTLGLYWPFAAVAMTRLRLEAVTLDLAVDAQTLAGDALAAEGEAAGDAAGDLFGIDIGL